MARDRSRRPRRISSSISGTARYPRDIDPHVGAGFFTQSDLVGDLSTRPKEIFDGATPSAHAVSTRALARLALCDATTSLLVIAQRLVELAGSLLVTHPSAVVDLVDGGGLRAATALKW